MVPSRRNVMRMMASMPAGAALVAASEPLTAVPSSAALPGLDDIALNSVNIRHFGALGDGKHDDTSAVQTAINSLIDTGGEIVFPPGDYLHAGIEVGTVGMFAEGALRLTSLAPVSEARGPFGREGARLICTSATATHFKFNDCQRIVFDGLGFTVAEGIIPTAGYALHINGGLRAVLTKCRFEGCYNSLFIDCNRKPLVEHTEIIGAKGEFGLRIGGRQNARIDQGHIENVFVHTAAIEGSPVTDGVQVGDYTRSINWFAVVTNQCRRGFVIGDGTSDLPAFHRFYAVDAENTFEEGILIQNGTHLWFYDVYSCVNHLDGIRISSNYANAKGGPIWFNNCRFSGNGRNGALLEACPEVKFIGCNVASNSQPNEPTGGPTNSYDGIRVTAPKAFLDVIGCRIGGSILEQADTVGNQRFGIHIADTVTKPSLLIIGNDLSGNASGAVDDHSSALATKAILGNIGPGLQGTATRDFGNATDASIRPTFDYAIHTVTATGNLQIDLSAAGFPDGWLGTIQVIVRMDNVGGHKITFSGVTHWNNGASPRLARAKGAINRLTFSSDDGGRTVMGSVVYCSHKPT